MTKPDYAPVETENIHKMLKNQKSKMKLYLSHCVRCTLCAESCFLYMKNDKDPTYMPSYKVINSLGKLYKERGRVTRKTLGEIKELVWNRCVLCRRCYCPIGVDIPNMISFARSICRSQDVYPEFGAVEARQSWL
jgi:Fe-S oxidoreductase